MPDELEAVLFESSELELRRRTGRSPPDEDEPEEEDELSELSEFEARRRAGLLPSFVPELEALVAVRPGKLSGSGRVGSSAAWEAIECSSSVPSLTNLILCAW